VRTLVEHLTAGVFTAVQRGALAAMTGATQGHVAARRAVYAARRDRPRRHAPRRGRGRRRPRGLLLRLVEAAAGLDTTTLLDVHRVAVAPGEGFGARGAGYARLSLAVADDELDEGVRRLAAAAGAAAA
jgi:aminotransferase